REVRETRGRKRDPVEYRGAARELEHVIYEQHGLATGYEQASRGLAVRATPAKRLEIVGGRLPAAVPADEMEEVVELVVFRVRGYVGAASLSSLHDLLGNQLVDRPAQRAHRDAVAAGEAPHAGDHFARLPLTGHQPAHEAVLDLLVERPDARTAAFRGQRH